MVDLQAIHEGLAQEEFFLEYLPICSLTSDRCMGAEALIRWRRGAVVLLPAAFMPVVEHTPLAGVLTYWVIETVGRELGDWLRAHPDIRMHLNVPPALLGRGGIAYAVTKAGLMDVAPQLVLEITEQDIPDKLGVQALQLAGRYGIHVALDDVGVADENLAVFARAHIDILKIDKSLADQLRDEGERPPWLKALSALVAVTPLQVIVEGVEEVGQVTKLQDTGIELAQGFYYSPPLSAEALMRFVHSRQQP